MRLSSGAKWRRSVSSSHGPKVAVMYSPIVVCLSVKRNARSEAVAGRIANGNRDTNPSRCKPRDTVVDRDGGRERDVGLEPPARQLAPAQALAHERVHLVTTRIEARARQPRPPPTA